MRRIGLWDEWAVRAFVVDDYSNWRNIGEIIAGQGLMYGHYDRTLKALSGIADKDWTLEITLSSNHMWGEKAPIDLASPDWQAARKRVRVLNLATTSLRGRFFGGRPILEVFDQDWLKSFVNDCSDLESLTIGTDDNAGWLLRNFQFPKLRHLTIVKGKYVFMSVPRKLPKDTFWNAREHYVQESLFRSTATPKRPLVVVYLHRKARGYAGGRRGCTT